MTISAEIGAEIGASAATGPTDLGVGDHDLDAARCLGRRIANLAKKLHGRSTASFSTPAGDSQ